VTPILRATGPGRHRLPGVVLAGLAAGALLAGCGGGGDSGTGRQAGATPAAESSAPKLADGMLPREAFGAGDTVVPVSAEQLQQGTAPAARAKDLTITPPECAAAVQGTQPDVTAFHDVAAQSATAGASTTVEVLMSGGPTTGALDAIDQAVARCPRAQVSSKEFGTATITFRSVPVDDLGDGAAALQFTTAVTQPDGTRVTVPALVGVVRDGDRLVTLVHLSQTGARPDAGAFAELLQHAYDAQAKVLD
jgi:hypothetical protein